MPYDLSATVHYKLTKSGNGDYTGKYTAISRSRDLQSQQWFMYDDEIVSLSNFTNKNTMVKKRHMKIATILFYVSPSIETHIKNAKTIDLMEGGNEQAQNVPNSEINPCQGDGKEGHADGSSRDIPIQTDSEGAKKPVDICVDGEEGKADGSSDKNDKNSTDPLGSSSYSSDSSSSGSSSDSSDSKESSSPAVVRPRPRRLLRNPNILTSTDSLRSSSDSSGSSSSGSSSDSQQIPVQQIPRTPHQIPWTPLERATHE